MNPFELDQVDYADAVQRYLNYGNSLKAVDNTLWKDAEGNAAGLIKGRATGNMPGTTPEGYGLWKDAEGQRLLRKAQGYKTVQATYSPGYSDESGNTEPAMYTINGKSKTEDELRQAGYKLPTAEQIAASRPQYDESGNVIKPATALNLEAPTFYEPMKNAPPVPVAPSPTVSQAKGGGGGMAAQERGLIGEVLAGKGAR